MAMHLPLIARCQQLIRAMARAVETTSNRTTLIGPIQIKDNLFNRVMLKTRTRRRQRPLSCRTPMLEEAVASPTPR